MRRVELMHHDGKYRTLCVAPDGHVRSGRLVGQAVDPNRLERGIRGALELYGGYIVLDCDECDTVCENACKDCDAMR